MKKRFLFVVTLLTLFTTSLLFFCACEEPTNPDDHAHRHNYSAITTAPTCTEKGYTTYTCTACGDSYVDNYVSVKGHSFGNWLDEEKATCTEDGILGHYHCSECKKDFDAQAHELDSIIISSRGHTESDWIVDSEATCTTAGSKHKECSVCHETLASETVKDLEHRYSSIVTSPTCTEKGYTTYTCNACGDSYVGDYIETNGHDYQDVITSPTCTEQGYTTYTCTACGDSYVDDYVEKSDHEWNEWEEKTAATCTSNGIEIRVCKNDSTHIETRLIPKAEHRYTAAVTEPTCTEQGYTVYTCTCGDSYIDDYVDELGHHYVNGLCENCGDQKISVGLKYSVNSNGTTCQITGIGTCMDTELFIPSIIDNYTVTSIASSAFKNCTALTSVTIPDSVTSIGSSAFSGCTGLLSIEIPDSVTSIASGAFESCSNLTSVTIPDSVTSIASGAFYGCSSLKEMTIPFIGTGKSASGFSAVFGAIFGCTYKRETSSNPPQGTTCQYSRYDATYYSYYYYYYIPNSLRKVKVTGEIIPSDAFYCCKNLTSIELSDSVTSIGKCAFSGCSGLTSVYYNGTIDQWVKISFEGSDSNPLYYAKNLYINNKPVTEVNITTATYINSYAFRAYTTLKSVTIGNSVTSIGKDVFSNCTGLTSIVIPDSVMIIDRYAFYGCTGLTNITIGASVTSIGFAAFHKCSKSLKNIIVSNDNSTYHIKNNCFIETASKTLILGCNNSVIPSDGSVTSIDSYAFYGCTSLTAVVIPDSVKSIGYSAFYDCSGLKSLAFKSLSGWYYTDNYTNWINKSNGSCKTMSSDSSANAELFKSNNYYWYRKS